ncbi:MAG: sigma 54-interacting transcriptional regulator [Marinisporobacter sp.]|jgi:transcriptional regulator with PAS, ATPase and Fis domain|nr:sigma 54-interacting transcriptional regulator [Marinisporobacter sp.]
MKKLIVVAKAKGIGRYYCQELRDFFVDEIQIDYVTSDSNNIQMVRDYDMVLITTYTIIDNIMKYVNQHCKIIKIVKSLSYEGIEKIKEIPYGSEALVVNVGPKTVSESIYLIYALGRTDLDLHPYYPGIEKYKKVNIILSQGELDLVPNYGGKVIDIFNTTLDTKTFLEIISYFDLDKKKLLGKLMQRSSVKKVNNDGVSFVISERFMLENIINVLFENLNEGVLIFNSVGEVTSSSNSVQVFLNKATHNILGKKITDIIPIDKNIIFEGEFVETIIKINNTHLICNIVPKITIGSNDYGLVILKKYNDAEMKIHLYKKELKDKGHKSKYTINDMIGSSYEIQKVKDIAVRMAKSDSTVLITGESGTGKELLAHVIHNHSRRKKEQFVAVNCSAIPENLLESELFGYEEGAFTGAKKGGKRGLFEIANDGTLFLDEIGEIPFHLQTRLLRVLQEKEIMRIGSNHIIDINVRIIVATNIDLKRQVKEGKFRRDLYYRLSVLPLNIPPLRNRGDDVLEIFDKIIKNRGEYLVLDEDVRDYFTKYSWDGNIRELRNCIEYMINLGKRKISLSDLPDNMKNNDRTVDAINTTKLEFQRKREAILRILYDKNKQNMKIGRKQISNELMKMSIFLSEQEVRKELLILKSMGLVSISKGRGGTKITQKGIAHLNI